MPTSQQNHFFLKQIREAQYKAKSMEEMNLSLRSRVDELEAENMRLISLLDKGSKVLKSLIEERKNHVIDTNEIKVK